jgi:hypothetical protein
MSEMAASCKVCRSAPGLVDIPNGPLVKHRWFLNDAANPGYVGQPTENH